MCARRTWNEQTHACAWKTSYCAFSGVSSSHNIVGIYLVHECHSENAQNSPRMLSTKMESHANALIHIILHFRSSLVRVRPTTAFRAAWDLRMIVLLCFMLCVCCVRWCDGIKSEKLPVDYHKLIIHSSQRASEWIHNLRTTNSHCGLVICKRVHTIE